MTYCNVFTLIILGFTVAEFSKGAKQYSCSNLCQHPLVASFKKNDFNTCTCKNGQPVCKNKNSQAQRSCPAKYDKKRCCCNKIGKNSYELNCVTGVKKPIPPKECNICSIPGVQSIKQNQCNTCSCKDGKIGGCTRMFCGSKGCPKNYDKKKCCCRKTATGEELDCIIEDEPPQECPDFCKRPDVLSYKENQCNQCTCRDGGAICTLMFCAPQGCPAGYDKDKCCCKKVDGGYALDCITAYKECNICKRSDVATFTQNQCNQCSCNSDGTVGGCTKKFCPPQGCPAGYDKKKCCCRTNKDGTQELDCVTQLKPQPREDPSQNPQCPPVAPPPSGVCNFLGVMKCGKGIPCATYEICCPTTCGGTGCVKVSSDCNLCSRPNVKSIIQNQCNTCSCQDGAPSICTEKACDSLGCPDGYDTSKCCCRKTPQGKYELDCIADCPNFCARPDVRSYKENMCNTCICGKNGERACTDMDCEPSGCSSPDFDSKKCCCRFTPNGQEMDCITEYNCDHLCKGVSQVWWGCNSCKCVNGKVTDGCTKIFCPKETLTCDSDYDPTQCCCREIKNADGSIQRRLICRDKFQK